MSPAAPHSSSSALGAELGPAIARHFERTFRTMAGQPGVVSEPGYFRIITGEAHPLGNCAVLPAGADLDAVRTAVTPLAALAVPSAVMLASTQPVATDVAAFLAECGYGALAAVPVMAVDIAALKPTALPEGYRLVRIGSGADGEEWVRQLAAGFDIPIGVANCFSPRAFGADASRPDATMQFFGVVHADAIVATTLLHLADGLAGIYDVSTLPAYRRKGLGEHVTAEPLRHAASLGYKVGILQSSEAGHPVYLRLGFADAGTFPRYIRMPG